MNFWKERGRYEMTSIVVLRGIRGFILDYIVVQGEVGSREILYLPSRLAENGTA